MMNKHLIVSGIVVLLICVGLSGCTEEVQDTDGDGYPDDADDFPTDSNLHEKNKTLLEGVTSPFNLTIEGNSYGESVHDFIDSDWKYVTITWQVFNPANLSLEEQKNISLNIRHRPNGTYFTESYYYYSNVSDRDISIPINSTITEEWVWSFLNLGVQRDFTIYAEIYKIR